MGELFLHVMRLCWGCNHSCTMTPVKISNIQHPRQSRDSFVIPSLSSSLLHLSGLGKTSSAPCQPLSCVFLGLRFDRCKIVIVMNQMCLTVSKLLWGQSELIKYSRRTYMLKRVLLWAVVALTFLLLLPFSALTQNSLSYSKFSLRCVAVFLWRGDCCAPGISLL